MRSLTLLRKGIAKTGFDAALPAIKIGGLNLIVGWAPAPVITTMYVTGWHHLYWVAGGIDAPLHFEIQACRSFLFPATFHNAEHG